MPTYDSIVVGAGIVGVSTALNLQMRGQKVLLVDRREPGKETSYGNAGIMEVSMSLPFGFPPVRNYLDIMLGRHPMARLRYRDLWATLPWIADFYFQSTLPKQYKQRALLDPLMVHALDEHQALMRDTNAQDYWRTTGRIGIYRTEQTFAESTNSRKAAEKFNIPFEVLEPKAVQAIEPYIKPNYHKAIRWLGSRRFTNPSGTVKAYADKFTRSGGTFVKANIHKLSQTASGEWQATAEAGTYAAKNVVICNGPWSPEILKPLGYHFPLGIKRGYHKHFAAIGGATMAHGISDVEYGYMLISMEQGFRITSGAEFARLDAPKNPIQIEQILPRVCELFPVGEAIEQHAWMGSRPCFTDSLPIVGAAPNHKGLWLNFGHGHIGMTIGPVTGRLMAEMIVGLPTFCDPAPYRADRF